MAALENPKHERFAQELAKGKSATEAYAEAGYSESRSSASRLLTNANIVARVAEITERAALRVEVSLASLIQEAEEVRAAALKDGQYSAAISAIKEKGVLSGVRIERRENTNRNIDELSDSDLLDIARAGGVGASTAQAGETKPH